MTRVKRGSITQKAGQNFVYLHQAFEAHSKLTRTISQRKIKALVLTHRDIDKEKKGFFAVCGSLE